MLPVAICKRCGKDFIPNNTTVKCTSCNGYRCFECVSKYGTSYDTVSSMCGCNSTNWCSLLHCISVTADERSWILNTAPEMNSHEIQHDQLRVKFEQLENEVKSVRMENKALKTKMGSMTEEIKKLNEIEECRKKESEEWKIEMEKMRNEVSTVRGLFVNFENLKDQPQDATLTEKKERICQESSELKSKFDEFEEYDQMIQNIQFDQERVEQNIKSMEERNSEVCSNLQVQIYDLQNQIDNFVLETKSDLNEKKTQLIIKMKGSIHQLQDKQKALIDRCRDLQQQNIKRSKVLQNELELTKHKFSDTVQMKSSLLSYYETEENGVLPTKGSEGLEKKNGFGSNVSLSTAASSFERIPDQQL